MTADKSVLPVERIERSILVLRGEKVILDEDIAALYGVETKTLIQAMKRNIERFPIDFMFQLNLEETSNLRYQIGTSSWGGRRYPPYAFTEQGVAMLSSVLRSDRAVRVNIEVMRAFARLRHLMTSQADLVRRLDELEQKYDSHFKVVFDALRQLMEPPRGAEPAHRLRGRLRSQTVTSNFHSAASFWPHSGQKLGVAFHLVAAAPAGPLLGRGGAALGAELGSFGLGAAGLAGDAGDFGRGRGPFIQFTDWAFSKA